MKYTSPRARWCYHFWQHRYMYKYVLYIVEMIDILNTESINLDPEVLQNTNDYIVSRIPVGTTHTRRTMVLVVLWSKQTP